VVGGRDGHQAEAADAAAGVPSCNITMSPCIRTGLRRSSRMRSEREAWPSRLVTKASTGCLQHPRADCGATRRPAGRLSRSHRRSSRACIFHGPRSAATSRRTSTFEHRFARRRRRRKSQRNRTREPAVARQGRRRSARAIAKRISYRWRQVAQPPVSPFRFQESSVGHSRA
jgi:hypothetical protein